MPDTTLPLIVANENEQGKTIEDIDSLPELLQYLANHLAANAGPITSVIDDLPIHIGSVEDSNPCGKQVQFIEGEPCYIKYEDCTFYPYPPNVAFLHIGSDYPSYLTPLTTEELDELGLSAPSIQSKGIWLIYKLS